MKLFLVGGFLGSGKTTAIYQAVNYLYHQGKKIGVITNDQGEQQVDTNFFRANHVLVEEVSGGCFCCNLPQLDRNIRALEKASQPEVIFAESVGSCTDLIATVVNPLLHANDRRLEIVLSVFADIQILLSLLQGNKKIFHENVNYIYEKQIEEADVIVVNKVDLIGEEQLQKAKELIEEQIGYKKILYQNSLNIEDVAKWIQTIFDLHQDPKLRTSLEVDYDKYGAGEAEMAWLDEEVGILTIDKDAVSTGGRFIKNIFEKIIERGYPIGHLKFLLNDGQKQQKISYTSISQPEIKQRYSRVKTDRVVILINARIQADPVHLRSIISDSIHELETSTGCKVIENKISSFKPGYPIPSQRISKY